MEKKYCQTQWAVILAEKKCPLRRFPMLSRLAFILNR